MYLRLPHIRRHTICMEEVTSGYHHTFWMVEPLIHFVWGKHCGVSPHTFCMINGHYVNILNFHWGSCPQAEPFIYEPFPYSKIFKRLQSPKKPLTFAIFLNYLISINRPKIPINIINVLLIKRDIFTIAKNNENKISEEILYLSWFKRKGTI